MTGAGITIDSRDTAEVQAVFRMLASLGRDPSPALKALGPLLVASKRNRIAFVWRATGR